MTRTTFDHTPRDYAGPVVFVVNGWNVGEDYDGVTVCGVFTNLDKATATAANATGFAKTAVDIYPLNVEL